MGHPTSEGYYEVYQIHHLLEISTLLQKIPQVQINKGLLDEPIIEKLVFMWKDCKKYKLSSAFSV